MQAEALEALQRLDYRLESKRLLVHAIHESRRYRWRGGQGTVSLSQDREAMLARGVSPGDIVQQSVLLTLEGSRPWNREKYPDISGHLRWVIRSLISNLATSADNRRMREIPEGPDEGWPELPEAETLKSSSGPAAADLSRRVREAIQNDPQLVDVCDRLQQGSKPAEVAAGMGLCDKDVYRLTQKLRRRLAPVLCASVPEGP